MNAYYQDIKRLLSAGDSKGVSYKIPSAKNHTDPIPSLISGLDLETMKTVEGVVSISSKESTDPYVMHFPTYSLKHSSDKLQVRIKEYLKNVASGAKRIRRYIDLAASNKNKRAKQQ